MSLKKKNQTTSKKPNILILMCDQLQGKIFHQDSPCIIPNLKKLASQSINFKNAYAANPVCSPARASLMTGELPHNHGVIHVTHTKDKDQSVLRTDHPHFAQKLQNSGYSMGYFGKWHVEHTETPTDFGWHIHQADPRHMKASKQTLTGIKKESEAYGYGTEKVMYAVTSSKTKDRPIGKICLSARNFLTDALQKDDPWCCFVSLPEPHDPYICYKEFHHMYENIDPPLAANFYDTLEGRPNLYKKATRSWATMTDEEKKEALRCYYASITEIDAEFGKILALIENRIDDTIIIFTSDHGDAMGAHGVYQKNVGAYEESYNIPLLIHAPNKLHNIVSSARVGTHDIAPTLLELAACESIHNTDSNSFTELFDSIDNESAYNKGYAEYEGTRYQFTQRIVYYDQWKYVLNGFDYDELYNLDEDPFEMTNRIDDPKCQDQLRKMVAYFWQKVSETGDRALLNSDYASLRLAPFGPYTNH